MEDINRNCERCGAGLRPTSSFCPQCGAPVEAPSPAAPVIPPTQVAPAGPDASFTEPAPLGLSPEAPAPYPQEPAYPAPQPQEAARGSRNRTCLILVGAGVLIALLICCLLVGINYL